MSLESKLAEQNTREREAINSDRLIRAKTVLAVKRFRTNLSAKAGTLQMDTDFLYELNRLLGEIESFLEDQEAGDRILDGPGRF